MGLYVLRHRLSRRAPPQETNKKQDGDTCAPPYSTQPFAPNRTRRYAGRGGCARRLYFSASHPPLDPPSPQENKQAHKQESSEISSTLHLKPPPPPSPLKNKKQRDALAEGMRSPAVLFNPDDSEDSDGYYFSDTDCPVEQNGVGGGSGVYSSRGAGGGGGGIHDDGDAPVPEWSELETAVQALMGMDGGADAREDGWDETESAR